jgi:hypothetical protein
MPHHGFAGSVAQVRPSDCPQSGRNPVLPFWDSLSCRFEGNWPFGTSWAVAFDSVRNHVYLGSGGGVLVLDMANLAAPRKVSDRIRTRGIVCDLGFDPSLRRLYIATQSNGLEIWDLTNDSLPAFLGRLTGSYFISYLTWSGSHLYVSGWQKFLVIDVSNPADPFEAGSVTTPAYLGGLATDGAHVFCAAGDSGLFVFDVTTPTNPQLVGRCVLPPYANDVALSGHYAYVGADTGLLAVDVQTPTSPTRVGALALPGSAMKVRIRGNTAYVADNYSGLRVVDISTPASPAEIGHFDINDYLYYAVPSGHYVYTACIYTGLRTIDVQTPSNPVQVDSFPVPGPAQSVALADSIACLAAGKLLYVLDISHPNLPQEIGSCVPTSDPVYVTVAGHYAYVCAYDLDIVDIANPADPHVVGTCPVPTYSYAMAVDVSGQYAYVSTRDSGLLVVDVSTPTNPVAVGRCPLPTNGAGVAHAGQYAYVSNRDSGLYCVSVSDPAHPAVVGRCTSYTSTYCRGIAARGNLVYQCDLGLKIIDVSDPAHPHVIGYCDSHGYAMGITVVGSRAYLGVYWGQFSIIDVSDSTNPQVVAWNDGPDYGYGTAFDGRYAYLANAQAGLQIYEPMLGGISEDPSRCAEGVGGQGPGVRLEANPAHRTAWLSLELPTRGAVSVELYNAVGQRVRSVPRVMLGAGHHSLELPLSGLAAGAYVVRVRLPGGVEQKKLVIE